MKVSFEGIGEQVVSFEAASGTKANEFVKVSANSKVANCSADDVFAGYCIAADGGFAEVMLHGYIEVGYTGTTAPTVGYDTLTAAGSGKVQADEDGREYLVIKVDTTNAVVGFMM